MPPADLRRGSSPGCGSRPRKHPAPPPSPARGRRRSPAPRARSEQSDARRAPRSLPDDDLRENASPTLHDPSAAEFVERASDVRLASATKSSPAATKGTGLASDLVGVLRAAPLPELELLYRLELSRYVRVVRAIVGDEQTALD